MSLLVVVSFSPKHRVHGACFLSQSDVVSTIVAAVINLARVGTHCYRDIQKRSPFSLALATVIVGGDSICISFAAAALVVAVAIIFVVARRPLTFVDRSLPLLLPLSSSLPSSFLRPSPLSFPSSPRPPSLLVVVIIVVVARPFEPPLSLLLLFCTGMCRATMMEYEEAATRGGRSWCSIEGQITVLASGIATPEIS